MGPLCLWQCFIPVRKICLCFELWPLLISLMILAPATIHETLCWNKELKATWSFSEEWNQSPINPDRCLVNHQWWLKKINTETESCCFKWMKKTTFRVCSSDMLSDICPLLWPTRKTEEVSRTKMRLRMPDHLEVTSDAAWVRTLRAPLTLTSSLSKIVLRWSQIVETDLGGEGTMSSDKSQCTENTQNKKSLGLKKQMIKQIWCAGRRFMLDCKREWERGIPSPQKSKIQSSWR